LWPLDLSWRSIGACLGGLIAGEGSFVITRQRPYADGSERLRFRFLISMAIRDRHCLEALRAVLGYGSIRDTPPARSHWQPISTLSVNSHFAHRVATIPFAEAFLLPTAKREQFERWRDALELFERAHPNPFGRGPSVCSIDDCDGRVRGRGLCRRHYYRATGH